MAVLFTLPGWYSLGWYSSEYLKLYFMYQEEGEVDKKQLNTMSEKIMNNGVMVGMQDPTITIITGVEADDIRLMVHKI